MSLLPEKEIFTVGHSTRTWDEFVALLRDHGIACLFDVRISPTSRRLPHFGKDRMSVALRERGIAYVHEPDLGGRRRPVRGSPNTGWRSRSFQGYADHMCTPRFEEALGRLMGTGLRTRSAVMCAEALWWRCHRMLISDALTVRGWQVRHILGANKTEDHRMTPFAVADGERLSYPSPQASLPISA
jgi:uncharacterized protein (DUF488 family)